MKAQSDTDILSRRYTTIPLTGVWALVIGQPERSGVWLIQGMEKNGKTWLSFLIAEMLSTFGLVLFISGDMGLRQVFQEALRRSKIEVPNRNIQYLPYTTIDELIARLKRPKAPRIVIIDNLTRYEEELKKSVYDALVLKFPTTLFIFLAHEEKGGRVNAITRHIRKYADVIMRVEGLAALVGGRCPGGWIVIDEEKAMIYHGSKILEAQR